jgi:hypothetical protein
MSGWCLLAYLVFYCSASFGWSGHHPMRSGHDGFHQNFRLRTYIISSDISLILRPTLHTVLELLPPRKDPLPPSKQGLSVVPSKGPLLGAVRWGMQVISLPATLMVEKVTMTSVRPVASANVMHNPSQSVWRTPILVVAFPLLMTAARQPVLPAARVTTRSVEEGISR